MASHLADSKGPWRSIGALTVVAAALLTVPAARWEK